MCRGQGNCARKGIPGPMRLGDLDGLDSVYDRFGTPLLGEGEHLEVEHTATALALFEGKRARGAPLIHHGQGEVECHLTDRRMLVLVDPSIEGARSVLHLPGEESWTRGMELFEVIQGRGRYFLELAWSEVVRVRLPGRGRDAVAVPLRPEGLGPHVLVVDRETAAWAQRAWRAWRAVD